MVNIQTIEERLTNEILELSELLPSEFKNQFLEEAYVAGGAIYSIYNNEEPKDIDVFIKTENLKNKLLSYFDNLKGLGYKSSKCGKLKYGKYKKLKLSISNNAITIGKYQIILKDLGEPRDVVSAFDFLHNTYWVENGKFGMLFGMRYLNSKKLYFNECRARDIVSTIIRTTKFIERGFTLDDKELSRMLLQLHEVGFSEDELNILKYMPSYTSFGSGM